MVCRSLSTPTELKLTITLWLNSSSAALGRRMEIDSYLKSMKQSISILDKHVAQLKEDNAVQISLVEGDALQFILAL